MSNEQQSEVIPVRIEFPEPAPELVQYTNSLVIHHTKDEFIVTFYRLIPPSLFGKEPEEVKNIQKVEAVPVSRIIVPVAKMPGFAKAFRDNITNYEEKHGPIPQAEEGERNNEP